MNGKICLVTGANAGIGFAISLGLAKKGATVVMVSRNKSRGETSLAKIKRISHNNSIFLLVADLSSQAEIRQLVINFNKKFNRLDILINNVGVITQQRILTKDGLEMQFALNHLAPFLLTDLLLESIKKSNSARIINISSTAHKNTRINFDDLQSVQSYNPVEVYKKTKLCNVLFTYELARRLKGTNITSNCLHPGVIRTKLLGNLLSFSELFGGKWGLNFIRWLRYKSPQKGAQTPLYLASSPDLDGVSGKYFDNKRMVDSSKESYELGPAKKLWDISKKLTEQK